MLLIISENHDNSTNRVIDWLISKNINYIRINENNPVFSDKINLSNSNINGKLNGINLSSFKSMWYRRGFIKVKHPYLKFLDDSYNQRLKFHVNNENKVLSNFIYKYLESNVKHTIGSFYKTTEINKLNILLTAKQVGLIVPDTLITSNKTEVISFYNKHRGGIISKPISDGIALEHKTIGYIYSYTKSIDVTNQIPEEFFPSLFQEKIDKLYEIRSFFLKDELYSMAIFSQNDDQTNTDFRNYNNARPNRNVPFKLPANIESKLISLANISGIDTGSFDLVVNKEGSFVFLEVNPVGQYDMVSYPCNYNLNEKIAEKLKY